MGQKAIVFIDGSNFYHNLRTNFATLRIKGGWIDYRKLSELVCNQLQLQYAKTIFYASIPSIADGPEAYHHHMQFIQSLKQSGIEVKTRKLQRLSNDALRAKRLIAVQAMNLCNSCRPQVEREFVSSLSKIQRREKGVDVMMAVDMLNAAVRGDCDCCVVISGDADFIPAMDAIRDHGVDVRSAFISCGGYSREIRNNHSYTYIKRGMLFSALRADKSVMQKDNIEPKNG